MQEIASPRNPLLKEIRKALVKGSLTSDGYAVAETFHLLEEALRSDRVIGAVLAAHSVQGTVRRHVGNLNGPRVAVIPDELFEQLSSTESSQGVIALVKPHVWTMENLFRGRTLLVILDGVQDPGNAGTIMRAAEAFGATGALFLKGSVSPYNAKALRASAGSLFRLPVVHGVDVELVKAALAQSRLDVYAAMPSAPRKPEDVDFTRKCAIIVGSEGRGISQNLRGSALDLAIPTAGVESLNVAIATSVILYEASRQRRMAGGVR